MEAMPAEERYLQLQKLQKRTAVFSGIYSTMIPGTTAALKLKALAAARKEGTIPSERLGPHRPGSCSR